MRKIEKECRKKSSRESKESCKLVCNAVAVIYSYDAKILFKNN